MKKLALQITILFMGVCYTSVSAVFANDVFDPTEAQIIEEKISKLFQEIEEAQENKYHCEPCGDLQYLSGYEEKIRELNKEVLRLTKDYEAALLKQAMIDQQPVYFNDKEINTFHPPFLRSVQVENDEGEIFYKATWKGGDFNNEALAEAAYKLLILQSLRREMIHSVEKTEQDLIQITQKFNNQMKEYGDSLVGQAAVNTWIEVFAIVISSEGNVVSLGVDAAFKAKDALKYAFFRDVFGNEFDVKLPNYPQELLELIQTHKGDPVKWAEEEAARLSDTDVSGSYFVPPRVNVQHFTDAITQYMQKGAGEFALKEGIKEAGKAALVKFSEKYPEKFFALEFGHTLIPGLKDKTLTSLGFDAASVGDATKGTAKSFLIDVAAATAQKLHELIRNVDKKFIDAAWTEIEWFVIRKQYHLFNAQLREFDIEVDKAITAYNAIYDKSKKEADGRELVIEADKFLKAGEYALNLEFNTKVLINKISLGKKVHWDNNGVLNASDLKFVIISEYYSGNSSKEDRYIKTYSIPFAYKEGDFNWTGSKDDLVLNIDAEDRKGRILDSHPETAPLYHPIADKWPDVAPSDKTKKFLNDVKDRWWAYEKGIDLNHALKQTKPIDVKATMQGAKPKFFGVR